MVARTLLCTSLHENIKLHNCSQKHTSENLTKVTRADVTETREKMRCKEEEDGFLFPLSRPTQHTVKETFWEEGGEGNGHRWEPVGVG